MSFQDFGVKTTTKVEGGRTIQMPPTIPIVLDTENKTAVELQSSMKEALEADACEVPAIVVKGFGVFTWGIDINQTLSRCQAIVKYLKENPK